MKRALAALALSGLIAGSASAADGAKIRFGIGFASLAEKQCPELRRGAAWHEMMRMLAGAAHARGEMFDEAGLVARSETEALAALGGGDLCAKAARVATPGGVIEKAD